MGRCIVLFGWQMNYHNLKRGLPYFEEYFAVGNFVGDFPVGGGDVGINEGLENKGCGRMKHVEAGSIKKRIFGSLWMC